MIIKDNNFKNKYILDDSSTNDDLKQVLESYDKVNCLICNKNTGKRFTVGIFGQSIITLNNKIPDNVVFVNGVY